MANQALIEALKENLQELALARFRQGQEIVAATRRVVGVGGAAMIVETRRLCPVDRRSDEGVCAVEEYEVAVSYDDPKRHQIVKSTGRPRKLRNPQDDCIPGTAESLARAARLGAAGRLIKDIYPACPKQRVFQAAGPSKKQREAYREAVIANTVEKKYKLPAYVTRQQRLFAQAFERQRRRGKYPTPGGAPTPSAPSGLPPASPLAPPEAPPVLVPLQETAPAAASADLGPVSPELDELFEEAATAASEAATARAAAAIGRAKSPRHRLTEEEKAVRAAARAEQKRTQRATPEHKAAVEAERRRREVERTAGSGSVIRPDVEEEKARRAAQKILGE